MISCTFGPVIEKLEMKTKNVSFCEYQWRGLIRLEGIESRVNKKALWWTSIVLINIHIRERTWVLRICAVLLCACMFSFFLCTISHMYLGNHLFDSRWLRAGITTVQIVHIRNLKRRCAGISALRCSGSSKYLIARPQPCTTRYWVRKTGGKRCF